MRCCLFIALTILLISSCTREGDRNTSNSRAEAHELEDEKHKKDNHAKEGDKLTSRPSLVVAVGDRRFAVEAIEAGFREVALSKIAVEKAKTESVKSFALKIVGEHGAANRELLTLCAAKGIILRTNCIECYPKREELSALSGDAFEKRYSEMMLADHRQVVEIFLHQSGAGQDADLKRWAAEKLPKFQHHLALAEELNREVSRLSASL